MLTITTTHNPATDIGYLLHKHPDKLQTFELNFGRAHVFYPEATQERCTAALFMEIDPIDLTRRGRRAGSAPDSLLQDYINDRPYTASSHLSVAITKIFGTALSGRCNEMPELVVTPIPLEAKVASVHSVNGPELIKSLFEPLGYEMDIETLPMDPAFPSWAEGHHHNLTLRSQDKTLRELLTHLYVLLPALDNQKHYWINQDETDKLLRFGEGWLDDHPARQTISRRYLRNNRNLTERAQEQFEERAAARAESADEDDNPDVLSNPDDPDSPDQNDTAQVTPTAPADDRPRPNPETELERPMSLQNLRIQAVMQELRDSGAKSVLDLGCGQGQLLKEILTEPQVQSVTGVEVSHRSLGTAKRRLKFNQLTPGLQSKLTFIHSSLIYRDPRLSNADAAVAMEVIEHIDPPKLDAFEDAVMATARPRTLIITTPNREYNILFPNFNTTFRHRDHRFEWTRAQFQEWAQTAALRNGYTVAFKGIGSHDEDHGPPTQMAVFTKSGPLPQA